MNGPPGLCPFISLIPPSLHRRNMTILINKAGLPNRSATEEATCHDPGAREQAAGPCSGAAVAERETRPVGQFLVLPAPRYHDLHRRWLGDPLPRVALFLPGLPARRGAAL